MVINQESTLEPPAAWQTEVPGKTGNDSETHPASAKSGEVIKVKMPLGRPEVSPLGSRYLRTGTTWSICLGGGPGRASEQRRVLDPKGNGRDGR